MAEEDVTRLERQAAAMEKDLAVRQDTQGDKFRITLEKKTYTDRAEAGTALVYLVNDHREDHLRGKAGTVVLGEMAGFQLEYRSTWPDKVTLRGTGEYVANVSPSPVGSISSLEHAARCIEEHLMKTRDELARCQRQAAELKGLNVTVFEHEERYRELLKRQGELVELLDITKNQAAAQQATETKDAVEAIATEVPETSAPAEAQNVDAPENRSSATIAPDSKPPAQRKSEGRNSANEAVILKAICDRAPVSLAAVERFNLRDALPRGYSLRGQEYIFEKPRRTARFAVSRKGAAHESSALPAGVTALKPARMKIAI